MGKFRENCEITEAEDEQSTSRRPQTSRQVQSHEQEHNNKPPFPKKIPNRTLEEDINKLFESVNLRSSKSLDLSDTWRNASKKPMRDTGSTSPGIGFSEPISLKQAFRGLCISQAAEMAALKRSSMPTSPRVSGTGKISTIYRSVLAETGEISSLSEGNSSSSSRMAPCSVRDSMVMSATQSSNSSPRFGIKPIVEKLETNLNQSERASVISTNEAVNGPEIVTAGDNLSKQEGKISGLDELSSVSSLKVAEKASTKLIRRKSRLQDVSYSSSVAKGNNKVGKNSTRVRPVIINKNLIIRKPKKVAAIPKDEKSKTSYEVNNDKICQKCQGSLRTETETNVTSKHGDISQSSKSSACDFSSSSITSLSDESNLSGLSCGSRPHMSKDTRWDAMNRIRKQNGFLGLSHFNLLKKLGSGDIGTVYLAELIGTNCPFAIKVMDNEFLGKRKKTVRAQTEREILKMLDHPFLPTLYAQFTSDNLSCLVMEFCPGGDLHVLRQKQAGRHFPEQAARFYVAEVLLALEYLHMLGIVYRDLKPENILVREDGHIMLTDFDLSLRCSVNPTLVKPSSLAIDPPRLSGPCTGSNCIDPFCSAPSCKISCFGPGLLQNSASRAKKLKADAIAHARSLPQLVAEPTEARSNSFVGTHEYLAPEIIKGEGHGSAVDWWTFGVFLYELLYGKTPFRGCDNDETLANVVMQNLRFPDTPIVSLQARDLIRRLLVKEPADRMGTETGAAEIKRHPFFEGLNWALIRCGSPPEVPEVYDMAGLQVSFLEKGKGYLDCGGGEQLEFELF
ncbi:hypothetical protein CASFOL_032206 [Castilleja foliolosa]|uniref:non-specific serine/threonine protein kinase n=1 Tax=Castilleja foliolosa TaxID=1961234 RepID=A0ABD3C0S4_9LAMI